MSHGKSLLRLCLTTSFYRMAKFIKQSQGMFKLVKALISEQREEFKASPCYWLTGWQVQTTFQLQASFPLSLHENDTKLISKMLRTQAIRTYRTFLWENNPYLVIYENIANQKVSTLLLYKHWRLAAASFQVAVVSGGERGYHHANWGPAKFYFSPFWGNKCKRWKWGE